MEFIGQVIVIGIIIIVVYGIYMLGSSVKRMRTQPRYRTRKGFFNSMSTKDKIKFLQEEKLRLKDKLLVPMYGNDRDKTHKLIEDITSEIKKLRGL